VFFGIVKLDIDYSRRFEDNYADDLQDVLDFGSLFSGNAIGPSRNLALRLTIRF